MILRVIAVCVIILSCLSFDSAASAALPEAVMKHYRQYKDAAAKGDKQGAIKAAEKAWKAAEKALGDHKTTGDLASNYALLGDNLLMERDYKSRRKAFLRAIELGKYHTKAPIDKQLDRELKYLSFVSKAQVFAKKGLKNTDSDVEDAAAAMLASLEAKGRLGGWHHGAMQSVRADYFYKRKKYKSVIEPGEAGLAIFQQLEETKPSRYKDGLILALGRAYAETGNHINAALTVQNSFNNASSDGLSEQSENVWLMSWAEISKAGKLEEAKAKGLCECSELKKSVIRPRPVMRVPPIIPAKAVRSGEAIVLFDVADDGSTQNLRIAAQTEEIFGEAVLKAAKDFIYTPALEYSDPQKRLNIPVQIFFKLDNGKNVIKARELEVLIPITENKDMISDEAVLISSGSRLRAGSYTTTNPPLGTNPPIGSRLKRN